VGDNNTKLLVVKLRVDCYQIKLGLITRPTNITGTNDSATDSV